MGSASSAANGQPTLQQMIANVKPGYRLDAMGEDNMWWPAEVLELQTQGKAFVLVRCENGYERKIPLLLGTRSNKQVEKLIAPLGTYTREHLTAAAAAEQLGPKAISQRDRPRGEESDDVVSAYKSTRKGIHSSSSSGSGSIVGSGNSSNQHIKSWMRIGARVDVLDIYKSSTTHQRTEKWRPATIIRVRNPELFVSFEGWNEEHNIWVDVSQDPHRVAKLGTQTKPTSSYSSAAGEDIPPASGEGGGVQGLRVGDSCFCKDKYISKTTKEPAWAWRPAQVIDIDGTQLLIHFTGWKSKWDNWFEMDSGRVMTVSEYESSGQTSSSHEAASTGHSSSASASASASASQNGKTKHNKARQADGHEVLSRRSKIPVCMQMPKTNGLGIVGLENLGNTCFMNSILQCLLNTAPLAAYFLNESHLKEQNIKSPMKGNFAAAFGDFMADYWSTRSQGIAHAPTQVKRVIGNFARQFDGFSQHDSQELLRYFLEGLHEDLNRVRTKPPYEEIKDDPTMSERDKCEVWWNNYEQRNDSSIKDIFCGQLRSYVTCRTCNSRSSAYDPFWDLSLPLPRRKSKCTIKDCLKLFAGDEILAGDDAYYCGKCKKHRKSTKNMSIQRWPLVLCLHAKRFNARGKLKTKLNFPGRDLDLHTIDSVISETAPAEQPPPLYHLIGVSNHIGSVHSGHYTADCLSPVSGEWNHYDDARVSPTSVSELSSSTAYVLFYARSDLRSYEWS